jgi:hypothetical protein
LLADGHNYHQRRGVGTLGFDAMMIDMQHAMAGFTEAEISF